MKDGSSHGVIDRGDAGLHGESSQPDEWRHETVLRAIMEQLTGPRQVIERSFLQMGEDLGACVKLLEEVAAAHEALPAELASSDFAAARLRLADVRDQAAAIAAAREDEKDHIGALADLAAEVEQPMSDLRRAVQAIGLIATNARIVTAGFISSGEDIAAFTKDMSMLARTVSEAVGAISKGYQQLMGHLKAAHIANQAFMARHGTTLARIRETLETQLQAIESHRARAAVIASECLERTGQIRNRIGQAIFALQIGDITRQRIEHVEAALDDRLHDRMEAEPLAAVCHLQCRLLDQATADFEMEVSKFGETIGQLSEHAAAVLRQGNSEADALLSSGGTALSKLIEELRGICALADEFERTRIERDQVIKDVAASVSAMAHHLKSVRAIEKQIRLLSFNATIQCCRVDEGENGRALRAIAEQLRELSGDTIVAASAVTDGLNKAEEKAALLIEQRTSIASQGTTAFTEGASDVIKALNGVTGRLREGAETVSRAGKDAEVLLETSGRRVLDRQHICGPWLQASAMLKALARSASERANPKAVNPAIAAELNARYTMDDERRIHADFFGQCFNDVEIAPKLTEAESLEDMFL